MKIPREMSGADLAALLKKYGYRVTRQSGSHMRLTTSLQGEHHITIPAHRSLKTGTVSGILSDIAGHFKKDKSALIQELF
jgi:predicted RNA binding protein YcfA (HicA-like mRNA interferase family)